jgi:hypothetical protein
MTLVFPILLGGLVLAGLPVLLHFLIRQKPKTLLFPAFRFLMQKQRSNTRNLRLRHLLLMLLRVALIVLLCFALSRPRILSDAFGISGEKPLAMVLVFDTSPSMDYKRGETSRLDLVKKRALELLEPLSEDCRIMILDSGDAATFGREDFVSLDKARQRIQGLAIRPNSGPVNRAIDEAMRRFQRWEGPAALNYPKFVCVFSDRTKASWDSSITISRSDEVKTLYFDVGVDDPIDVAITHIEFANGRQSFTEGESIELHAIVKATGNAAKIDSELIVELDGKPLKKPTPFSVGKDQQETITLVFDPLEHKLGVGLHQVDVRLISTSDALAFNNQRFATFEIRKKPRVLVLADDLKKVRRFADTLEVLLYDVDRKTLQDKASYTDYEAVFLVEAAAPDDKLWQALLAFVEQGGGVAVIAGGDEMNLKAYDSVAAQKLLPTRILRRVDSREGVAWAIAENHFQHPFMRPFQSWVERSDINFLQHKRLAYQYWKLDALKNVQDRETIVEYEGTNDPAVAERRVPKSKGKVLLFSTSLDEREPAWSNYAKDVTSFYLTLTWLTARHLVAESARVNLNHVFGQAMPTVRARPGLPKATLTGPNLKEEIQFGDKTQVWRGERLSRDGHYAVTASNPDTQQSKVIASFSVNIPSEESDLTRLPKEQIEAALGKDSVIPQDQHTPLIETIAPYWEEPVELFPFLMIVLLVLFALENLIANKFYRQEPQPS